MLESKNIASPDDKRSFEHGEVSLVNLTGFTVGRADFRPGWRWSTDVKPLAGTDSCQLAHSSYVVSGRFHVVMDDGRELELGPGDAHLVGPGHDAWVVGDEPCVTIDFIPATRGRPRRPLPVRGGVPGRRRRPARPPGGGHPGARQGVARPRGDP